MQALTRLWHQPRQSRLRQALFQIHLWLGLIGGLLVGLVGFTGALVVYRVEMNYLTTPGTGYVTPQAQRKPLDDIIAAVLREHPRDKVFNAAFDTGPDVAWNIRTTTPEGHRIHNFVDQYRGVLIGRDDYTNKFLQWLWSLHADLLAGKTGRLVNGWIAVGTLVLSLSGLVIWWPGRKLWRNGFTYLFGGRWQRQNYDLHKLAGFYSSLLLALVSFTGAYFSFPDFYKTWTKNITRATNIGEPDPCATTGGPPAKTRMADRQISYEDYIRMAEKAMPGGTAVYISFPGTPGKGVGVKLKEENDWHRVGLSNVYLEPATGEVLYVDQFSKNTLGTKFIKLMLPLHFGRFGGRLGWGAFGNHLIMILYVLIGVGTLVLAVSGFLMYWNRSFVKKVRRWKAGPAPAASRPAPAGATR